MAPFRVVITRISSAREVRAKYLVTLTTEKTEGGRATFMPISDDTALHDTKTSLGISEPQQERVQSLLNEGRDQVLNLDIPGQIDVEFGWA